MGLRKIFGFISLIIGLIFFIPFTILYLENIHSSLDFLTTVLYFSGSFFGLILIIIGLVALLKG
jgi:TRAP-type C4-dicarboxylate transport system permease small subunit